MKIYIIKYFTLALGLIFLFLQNNFCFGQKFGDVKYYLVDSLPIDKLTPEDRSLIESALKTYHSAKHDTSKLAAIIEIAEQCSNDFIWPKYNRFVMETAQKKLQQKGLNNAEAFSYKSSLAGAINNEGYINVMTGHFKEGEALYLKALNLLEEIGEEKQQSVVLSGLGVICQNVGDIKKAIFYLEKAIEIQERIGFKKGYAQSINNIAMCYQQKGDYDLAKANFNKSLPLLLEINDKVGAAQVISNLAYVNEMLGNIPLAIDYNLKSLKIREEIKDWHGMAQSLNNIAVIYSGQNEIEKALENYSKCIKIADSINDNQMESRVLFNMGRIYSDKRDFKTARELYSKALKIAEEVGDKHSIAQGLEFLGGLCSRDKRYTEAYTYYQKALAISQESEDVKMEASVLKSLSELEEKKGNNKAAYDFVKKALEIFKDMKNIQGIRDCAFRLSSLEGKNQNWSEAYRYMNIYYEMRDSLSNETNRKAAIKSQFQYEYNKKVTADSIKSIEKNKLKDAQLLAQQSKLKQEKTTRLALYGGLALVLIFALFMFNRYKITQSQKLIIENQKILVEEKQKEVLDSIAYAKRLQLAILPPVKQISNVYPDSFVLYKPKAIVAGDFYWMHNQPSNENNNGITLLAVADCTGHGVPGALVSVVCSNALNQSVNEFGLSIPGKILDKTRDLVLDTFSKSEGEVKDGMDISLVAISNRKNNESVEVKWAGANNPLWILSNVKQTKPEIKEVLSSDDYSFYELKPDKQPVGNTYHPKPFTTHEMNLQKGDTLYLFTDGFADQFGGTQGKKFKYKQLQQIIFDNRHLPLEKQSELLLSSFNNWMGDLEQIDDVCIIGIKI